MIAKVARFCCDKSRPHASQCGIMEGRWPEAKADRTAIRSARRTGITIFALTAGFIVTTSVAFAQVDWVDGNGNWFDPNNWDAGVPQASTNAFIDNGGSASIAGGTATSQDLFLGTSNGFGGLSLSGSGQLTTRGGYIGGYFGFDSHATGSATVAGSSKWILSGQGNLLVIGGSGTGILDVSSGGSVSNGAGYVGLLSGVHGTVSVDGAGSIWTNSSPLQIGVSGTGTVDITNGGAVSADSGQIASNAGSTGTLTVDGQVNGTGSSWTDTHGLYVGYKGNGTFNVTNGAVASSAFGSIGVFSSATGTVTVDGTESTWTSADFLEIGSEGTGTLNITQGGTVSNVDGYVGSNAGSTGTVNVGEFGGPGVVSTWTNSGTLYVGYDGTGTVNITVGGAVSSATGIIGRDAGSVGTVVVDGGGWTITGDPIGSDLTVGYDGAGKLNIMNAGTVSNDDGYIGAIASSSGTVTVDGSGSTWTNKLSLNVGTAGMGTLNITNGGQVTSDSGVVGGASGGNGDVFISGSGDISSNWTVANKLQVGVDDATGHIIVASAGILKAGSLIVGTGTHDSSAPLSATVEVGGAAAYISDQLIVGDTGLGQLTIESAGLVSVANDISPTESYIGHDAGAEGTVTVDGVGSKFSTAGSLLVGYDGTGTLNITQGGAVDDSSGFIGFDPGSTGKVNVDGAGSTWENSFLSVGNRGNGTLDISNGGTVMSDHGFVGRYVGSVGTVTLDGAGSTWTTSSDLNIGMEGTATVTIANHAVMMSDSGVVGGTTQGESGGTSGNGAVTINGAGSSWSVTHELGVGVNDSIASVVVENGGLLHADTLVIGTGIHGSAAPLSATVGLNGGTLNATSITVGDSGLGALNVENNSSANTTDLIIGGMSTSEGQVSVSANSSVSAANVIVGNLGSGQLDIMGNSVMVVSTEFIIGKNGTGIVTSEASTVTVNSDVIVGDTSLGAGSLNIGNAAIWSINGNLVIGSSGVGTTDVAATGSLTANNVEIGARGTLSGDGTINANVINDGLISPGHSPGILHINGSYTQNSGALNIEIAGLATGSFDVLAVSGSAILSGGALHFLFLNGFLPRTGDMIQFLNSGSPPLINLANITMDYSGAAPGFEFAVVPVTNGLDFVALNDAQAVPEPSVMLLLASSGAILLAVRRRKASVPLVAITSINIRRDTRAGERTGRFRFQIPGTRKFFPRNCG